MVEIAKYLDETDIVCLFTETLTANVQAIFANETSAMRANAAIILVSSYLLQQYSNHILEECMIYPTIDGLLFHSRVGERTRQLREP